MTKRVTTFKAFKLFVNRQPRDRRISNKDRNGLPSWNTCAIGDFHKEQTGTRPKARLALNNWANDTLPLNVFHVLNDMRTSPKSYGKLQDLLVELGV